MQELPAEKIIQIIKLNLHRLIMNIHQQAIGFSMGCSLL